VFNVSQNAVCLPGCQGMLLVQDELGVNQHSQVSCPSSLNLYMCLVLLHTWCSTWPFPLLNFLLLLIAQCSNLFIPFIHQVGDLIIEGDQITKAGLSLHESMLIKLDNSFVFYLILIIFRIIFSIIFSETEVRLSSL